MNKEIIQQLIDFSRIENLEWGSYEKLFYNNYNST
jgi:hypothetical protein